MWRMLFTTVTPTTKYLSFRSKSCSYITNHYTVCYTWTENWLYGSSRAHLIAKMQLDENEIIRESLARFFQTWRFYHSFSTQFSVFCEINLLHLFSKDMFTCCFLAKMDWSCLKLNEKNGENKFKNSLLTNRKIQKRAIDTFFFWNLQWFHFVGFRSDP